MSKGLEGMVVADTSRSRVQGDIGQLIYHGYDIADLGANASFEEVVYLLWHSSMPTADELTAFKNELIALRGIPGPIKAVMNVLPKGGHPVAALRTLVSSMALVDPAADDISPENSLAIAKRLTAVFPTLIAGWEQLRRGREPIEPRSDLDHAANFLYMLTGHDPSPEAVEAIDTYLILLADHGFNASTFSARVTTGTLADMYSAITSALGTLKGPAHGGAAQAAMQQFIEAREMGVEAWYKKAREEGRRIMGIGHRVYKVEDPRAKIFGPLAQQLAESSESAVWYDIAVQIKELTRSDPYFVDRNLFPNVDYYSAAVLYMIGIPLDQFTSVFAMGRIAGWTAHVLEQVADNRLIRPKARYVGPEQRKINEFKEVSRS